MQVSPDVSGIVSEVHVHNDQAVRCGQVLFVVDQARFELAVREAQAAVEADEAALDQARKVSRRDQTLTNLVTGEQIEADTAKVLQLIAQLRGAQVLRDTAKLNLERSTIHASVNGIVTNLELQPGDFATAGHQVLALLDTDAVYVDAYFEETKLPSIQVGDRARVHLMGVRAELQGSVTSVAGGIEDRERGASSTALANINPTFSWVRLAQRIPVRVELQNVPQDIRLICSSPEFPCTPRRRQSTAFAARRRPSARSGSLHIERIIRTLPAFRIARSPSVVRSGSMASNCNFVTTVRARLFESQSRSRPRCARLLSGILFTTMYIHGWQRVGLRSGLHS